MSDPEQFRPTFTSEEWGTVIVDPVLYRQTNTLAIQLYIIPDDNGFEPLGVLSVCVPGKSELLPADCFYVKEWSENARLSVEAAASGWFAFRADLKPVICGFELAPVWQLRTKRGEGFNPEEV